MPATGAAKPVTILFLLKRVDCNDGVAAYLESIIVGLRELGDRVLVISGEVTNLYGSEFRQKLIKTAALDWVVIPGLGKPASSLACISRIYRLAVHHRVDVVSPQGFAILPLGHLVGLVSNRPVVSNYHPSLQGDDTEAMTGRLPLKERLAYRAICTLFRSDRYIAMSTDIETFFVKQCRIPHWRIKKQVLGVETDFYRAPSQHERDTARAGFTHDPTALVVVLPGRLNISKGHDVVAAAVWMLRATRPEMPIICLFPGDGDQREQIETGILREETDRAVFRFLGFVNRDLLRQAYWAADILLLPSRREGFGLVVAEAMCCGTPVIRTSSGGWQDQVVEGVTGYIVPFNDPQALALAIERIADSPERPTMREAAMQLASTRFSRSRMIAGTSRLYREIAARRTGMQYELVDVQASLNE